MPTLIEMAKNIVAAHSGNTTMTTQELVATIQDVYSALQVLEKRQGVPSLAVPAQPGEAAAISKRKAFGKNTITCMICGKEMKTLARHLKTFHGMNPGEYRKQFDIPRTQPLAARAYSESRKQMAIDRGLGEKLAEARAARAARGKGKGRGKKKAATV